MVHALFVDHAHLMQKPRRFCGAGGDDGLYALQRLAASLSKLLPVASPSRLDADQHCSPFGSGGNAEDHGERSIPRRAACIATCVGFILIPFSFALNP